MDLDAILDEKTKPEAPAVVAPEPEGGEPAAPPVDRPSSLRNQHREKEYAAQGRDPKTGKFVPKEGEPEARVDEPAAAPEAKPEAKPAAPVTPPAQDMTPKEKAAFAAAADERRKRQALEQQLAQMRQQQQPTAQPQPGEQPKTFWDDPEGNLKRAQEAMRQEGLSIRMNTTEILARNRYPDFQEKVDKFSELVQTTPGLAQQWVAAPDPADFAYRVAKQHIELEQFGSIEDWKASETARIRAEVEAQVASKAKEQQARVAAIPPSLSAAKGAGAKNQPAFSGPPSLDSILGKE